MKITIFIATANEVMHQQARVKSDGLIPVDLRKSGYYKENGARFRLLSFLAQHSIKGDDVVDALIKGIGSDDRVVVLCDESLPFLRTEYSKAFFVYAIRSDMEGKTADNYLRMSLAESLRKFAAYDLRFRQAKYQKLFLLPLENFHSQETTRMKEIFADLRSINRLPSELDRIIAALISRQRPKVTSNYPTQYIADDRNLHFSHGHEAHALPDTAVPPHSKACDYNANFRFGEKYPNNKHFNVSYDHPTKTVTGVFAGCHGNDVPVSGKKHMNMFSNDFQT